MIAIDILLFVAWLPVHLYASLLGQVAWAASYLEDGYPVRESYVLVAGPRYVSTKIDVPGTDRAAWGYWGDESEKGVCSKPQGEVDEQEWAHRVRSWPTKNLRGDETR